MTNFQQAAQAIAIAEAIRELHEVPSGHLYVRDRRKRMADLLWRYVEATIIVVIAVAVFIAAFSVLVYLVTQPGDENGG